ncbi:MULTISPECIES: hypothetical protein [Bacillus amyloliquefaciens group]|uniref:hypothetical protein n=1 Tax=Bacillus amyloliquefaciens group TaxID=1938374 RepID=UPI00226F67D4|nr:hypothetical protein [Bacillus velezensis]MCY0089221.1 hypothetical protein [Bacillus velezensis]
MEIKKAVLLQVLDSLFEHEIIPRTYQFTRAECVNFNGENKIRFHFTEWSYPAVWGEPATCILPDELSQLVEMQ